jgi:hypothetical protein
MIIPKRVCGVFSPPSEDTKHDTGLRFTDILFGFVISQIFLRLQQWSSLSEFSRMQLVCSTALVLGSWIGFRRSLNRPDYELKFFNLPLLRFLLDQMMLILYFRVATLTPLDPDKSVDVTQVTHDTLKALVFVFVLYFLWDLAGQAMALPRNRYPTGKKYPKSKRDLTGLSITFAFLLATLAFWHIADSIENVNETALMIASTGVLVAYRWVKDIRSTFRLLGERHEKETKAPAL